MFEDLVDPPAQRLRRVVLGVQVATGERVELARGERPHEPRRALRRRPRHVVREARRHLRPHHARADHEDRDPVAKGSCERLAVAAHGGLGGRVRGLALSGQVRGPAADNHDPAGAALEHPGNDGAAAEVDAEHIHLECPPPHLRVPLPRRTFALRCAGVCDEQVERPRPGEPALDVLAIRHVANQCAAADLCSDRLDLLGGAAADGDLHAGRRELAGDALADPAPAAGHERRPGQLAHGRDSTRRRKLASANLVRANFRTR